MKKLISLWLVGLMLFTFTGCGGSGDDKQAADKGIAGQYTGKITMKKLDAGFITAYQSPTDKKNIANLADPGALNSLLFMIKNRQTMAADGLKKVLNGQGDFSLSIWKNVNSKATIDSDYIIDTTMGTVGGLYANYLPRDPNRDPYWAVFKDKRNGEITMTVTDTTLQLVNKVTVEDGSVITYTLDGKINGTKISGTWTQLWGGVEAYSGVFEVEKTGIELGDK